MTGASPAVLAAFDTASTPDRISGAAHISASRVTSRRWALLPAPSTPDQTRFAISLGGRAIGELAIRCRIAGARWSALIEVSGDLSDPEVHAGITAFATAFADAVRAMDPSLRQIAAAPGGSPRPTPPPPPGFGGLPLPPPPPARPVAPLPSAPPARITPAASPAHIAPPRGPVPPPPPPPIAPPAFGGSPIPPTPAVVAAPPTPPAYPAPPAPPLPPATAFAPTPAAPTPPAEPAAWAQSTPAPIADDDESEATVLTPRSRAARVRPWTLTLPDGATFAVIGATVVGRRPSAPASHPDATVLTLPDPQKMLSKTHALIEVETEAVWITDLDSTNGTDLVSPDGTVSPLTPRERSRVVDGQTLSFGELPVRFDAP